jgi:S-adenosylmethionine:tRNA ribosyltransferase-isomerase
MSDATSMDDLSLYDYKLPPERIAREPPPRRDDARLLVVDRAGGKLEHRGIRDLPDLLQPGDCLVLNDTQVLPARIFGTRAATGGKWEGLYLGATSAGDWKLIGETRGRIQPGEQIILFPAHRLTATDRLTLTLREKDDDGVWTARVDGDDSAIELLQQFGTVPLPPYIGRKLADTSDWERYQTTYARSPGAVAAPTAGLHFTPELLEACTARGLRRAAVTLHVGIGTFRPISVEKLSDHRMHAEWCELPSESAVILNQTRAAGGRIVAVGTTSVRTLESAAQHNPQGSLATWSGETDLFIRPPYEFRATDVLLTNFHLPRSTLLVLVSAFAGRELIQEAYQCALHAGYRFYSYGDAMLIV